jgi:hypothetical protein
MMDLTEHWRLLREREKERADSWEKWEKEDRRLKILGRMILAVIFAGLVLIGICGGAR